MRRRLILALSALAIATPSLAAEHGKAEGEADKGAADIALATVGLPVIIDGRLVNYVFASIKLTLAPGANATALRTKEPYYRDALIKAAHRTPFTLAGNPNRLDEVALKRVMLAEAQRIAGPRSFVAVQVVSQQPKSNIRTGR